MESKNGNSSCYYIPILESVMHNSTDPTTKSFIKTVVNMLHDLRNSRTTTPDDASTYNPIDITKLFTNITPFTISTEKADAFVARFTEIVKISISNPALANDVMVTLNTILNKHTENPFNGFTTQQSARDTLSFLFPKLETTALNKLSILMVAPIL